MNPGLAAERNATQRQVHGRMAVLSLLIAAIAAVSSGFAPAPLGAAAGVAPSLSEHQLAKPPSAKLAVNCVEGVLDSFEDDDLSADSLASPCFEMGESAAEHGADVRDVASIALAWAQLPRGPPST